MRKSTPLQGGRHWWLITADLNRESRLSGPETLRCSRLNANKDQGSSLLHMWEPCNVSLRRLVSGERARRWGRSAAGGFISGVFTVCLSDIPARWTQTFLSVSPLKRRPVSSPRYLRPSTLSLAVAFSWGGVGEGRTMGLGSARWYYYYFF